MGIKCRILATAVVIAFGMSVSHAADQTILGDTLQLKDPSTADKRKIVGKAKEKASDNTLGGDPTVAGATLTIRANGGTPSSQTFSLPAGTSPSTGKPFWSGDPVRGFKYKDSKSENGPIKGVVIKKSGNGVFLIKATGGSKVAPITVLPPDAGTDGCLLLEIAGGDSYSVQFGPLDGVVTNKGPREYKHKKPSAEGTCITTTTTSSSTTSTTSSTSTTSTTTTTTSSTTTTTLCPDHIFLLEEYARDDTSLFDHDFDLSDEWKGGTVQVSAGHAGCSIYVRVPSGNIDVVGTLGDRWTIVGFDGFSDCYATGGEDGDGCFAPDCDNGGGFCQNGRPSCSIGLGDGGQTAQFQVQCVN
jgi:hypothetical protein